MDLRSLRVFVEVVRHGGFSAATETLHVSQSTVSKTIKQLEEQIGATLLERRGHEFCPTASGEVVYHHALTLLAERENLQAALDELGGLKRGRLRLGLSRLGSSLLFGRLVAEFNRRYPGVALELVEHGSLHLADILRKGELDLAMCMLPLPEELEWQLVHDEPLMVLLPADHPLVGAGVCRPAHLADSPFILFESGFALNAHILAACQRHGFTPRVVAYSGQADFIQALVAAGIGVAFLPRVIAAGLRPPIAGALLNDEGLRWRMTLAWRRDSSLSPAARAFRELVQEALGNSPGQDVR
jgi:DNA-binding transcriptional LysR family regulator